MNFMVVVGILMLHTYITAIAAPPPLRYDNLDSNMTLTSPLTSAANALPPDPNILILPSVGWITCYSYAESPWNDDIRRLLDYIGSDVVMHMEDGQANQSVQYVRRYSAGHASFLVEPSSQLTWLMLSLVVGFMGLNADLYTPGTFLLEVSGGPSGDWNGSLTTHY